MGTILLKPRRNPEFKNNLIPKDLNLLSWKTTKAYILQIAGSRVR